MAAAVVASERESRIGVLCVIVRQGRYEPTCVDGEPIKAEITITGRIEFR